MIHLLVTLGVMIAVPPLRVILGIKIIFTPLLHVIWRIIVATVVFVYVSCDHLVLEPIARVIYGMIIAVASLVFRPPHSGLLATVGIIVAATSLVFRKPAPDDFEGAIIYHRRALALRPPGSLFHGASLHNLAYALWTRFNNTGQMMDLENAITHHRVALGLCPPGHPDRSMPLNGLALALKTRFNQTGQMVDLEEAIMHHRAALDLCPPGHPRRSVSLDGLAVALGTRFNQTGQKVDLDEAVTHHRAALDLCPPGHPRRSVLLDNLALALRVRFYRMGQMVDLEEAITHHRAALDLCPPGHPGRSVPLDTLGLALQIRFNQTGQMVELKEAITHHRAALDLCYPGHPRRYMPLDSLALALWIRFNQTGQMVDLEEAITHHRAALELLPPGHPDRSIFFNHFALALQTRFKQTGQMEDLEEAITHFRSALDLCSPEQPDRSPALCNLAQALETRFNQMGQMVDLQEAITHQRASLELCPPGHPRRSVPLGNLALALKTCFNQTRQMADLEEAIKHHRAALDLCPPGNPDRSIPLNNLAFALKTHFDRTKQMADLEEAITHHHNALDLRPLGHPIRAISLDNLALALKTRFDRKEQMVDLEEAITHHRSALELLPPGHPDRSMSLNGLALALETRFDRLACNDSEDLHEAVGLMQSGANDSFDTPAHRYSCASELISTLTKYTHHGLLEAFEMALNLLQLSLAVYPDVELCREVLGSNPLSPSLAMSAAAHAIEHGHVEKAIELLEQGRGMLWSNIRGYRYPIDEVGQVDPDLAERFKVTSEQLEALATSSQLASVQSSGKSPNVHRAVSEAKWARQRQLSSEREGIIQQIRQLVGFEHFLKAVPFSELQAAASEGPIIIINIARGRSDIIILHQHDTPIILPLSVNGQDCQAAYRTIEGLSEVFFDTRGKPGFSAVLESNILKTLEDILVAPVIEKLEKLGVRKNARIWWCPTSVLCALPIHAAGQLPLKFVSSYTPTLSALISARNVINKQSPALGSVSDSKPSLLAVIHRGHPPKTEDDPDQLRTVTIERKVIEKAAENAEKAAEKAAGPGRVCSLAEADATREAVLGQLTNYPWVHFACHGLLNVSHPFQSAFQLENDPLSLSDLVKARLPNADFAFLAACDSATAGSTSTTPDEALHLAAAVQFCGVRSVVGTLWPMADQDGPRVAQVFYRHMFKENDSQKSAQALHQVVLNMMGKSGPWKNTEAIDEGVFLPRWANYIHIGA